jgi:hypothetical protein
MDSVAAVVLIQAHVRGWRQREAYRFMRRYFKQHEPQVVKIQRAYRGYRRRKTLQPLQQQQPLASKSPPVDAAAIATVRVVHAYTAAAEDELSLQPGDVLVACEIFSPEWSEGTLEKTGKRGLFPTAYTPTPSTTPAAAAAALPPAPQPASGWTVRALYDYDGAEDDELNFKVHDLIVDCHTLDDSWTKGRHLATAKVGMFPTNYVQRVADDETAPQHAATAEMAPVRE